MSFLSARFVYLYGEAPILIDTNVKNLTFKETFVDVGPRKYDQQTHDADKQVNGACELDTMR